MEMMFYENTCIIKKCNIFPDFITKFDKNWTFTSVFVIVVMLLRNEYAGDYF